MSSTQFDSIIVRYGELSLKNNNRPEFERQLVSNIQRATAEFNVADVNRLKGAIRLDLNPSNDLDGVLSRLGTIPGIAWYAPAKRVERDLDRVARVALELGQSRVDGAETFGVNTQRSDKEFEQNTPEINTYVGGIIDEQTDLSVDLDDPDWTIHVHVLHDEIQLFFNKHEGLQGLPVETTGSVITQLSGGIDSPVAAVEVMKRGCRTDFIHFYPFAEPQQSLDTLMEQLVTRLGQFSTEGTLFLAPYYPFELGTTDISEDYKMILFRRHVLRVTEHLARREDHEAIVTGESLGQVASQTMSNLRTISEVATLPVLRPLIGRNKNEIIERARHYGTYEMSISNYKDCCSVQSNHPKTTSDSERLEMMEKRHDLSSVDQEVIDEITSVRFSTQGLESVESMTG